MYRIRPIQLGRGTRPKSIYTYLHGYYDTVESFYGVYLIQGYETNILVDTGINALEYQKHSHHMFSDTQSISQGLNEYGLSENSIDLIIQTHLHFDHCSFLKHFPRASKLIQKREVEYAYSPHPLFRHLYHLPFYHGIEFDVIEGDKEILPGLSVLHVPGHTPGCQAVVVQTKEEIVAISGFCCIADNFLQKSDKCSEGEQIIIPTYHENPLLAYKSNLRIMEIANAVFPMHQGELVKLR